MTQMLLFDSPTIPGETDMLTLPNSLVVESEKTSDEANAAAQFGPESGLHHMGDLARLVLLRYDLMAKRRAKMAGRRARMAGRE